MTAEKNARTKENMLIIVIEKAISDPPFNSASVCTAFWEAPCQRCQRNISIPVHSSFFREYKNDCRRNVSSLPRVMNGSRQTGRIQRCHFSGIKWDQVFCNYSPLRHSQHLCSFSFFIRSVFTSPLCSPEHLETL